MTMAVFQWAMRQRPESWTQKLTLSTLGFLSNRHRETHATVDEIVEMTQLNHKTVRKNVFALAEQGFIEAVYGELPLRNGVIAIRVLKQQRADRECQPVGGDCPA